MLLIYLLIAGCAQTKMHSFGLATDNHLAYLGSEIAFTTPSDWMHYTPLINLTLNITKGMNTQEDKVKALAYYVSNSKKYNESSLKRQLVSSVIDIFKSEEGVCYDGAVELVAMARLVGVPARVVFPLFENHAFAQVFVNGKWVNIDATFGRVNYGFETLQPLYIYTKYNESLLQRAFIDIKAPKLTLPVTSNRVNGEHFLISIKRKTYGKEYSCEDLICTYKETQAEFQPIMVGFEALKDIHKPEDNTILDGFFTVVLLEGVYKIEYMLEHSQECVGFAMVNLTRDMILNPSEIKRCSNSSIQAFKSLKHGLTSVARALQGSG